MCHLPSFVFQWCNAVDQEERRGGGNPRCFLVGKRAHEGGGSWGEGTAFGIGERHWAELRREGDIHKKHRGIRTEGRMTTVPSSHPGETRRSNKGGLGFSVSMCIYGERGVPRTGGKKYTCVSMEREKQTVRPRSVYRSPRTSTKVEREVGLGGFRFRVVSEL